jgi:hypothetical protein
MSRFGQYGVAREFTIGEEKFEFKPLSYKDIGKFWKIMQHMNKVTRKFFTKDKKELTDDESQEVFASFDEVTLADLVYLEQQMVKQSYPDEKEDEVAAFVAKNVFNLIAPLIEVNIGTYAQPPK